MKKIVKQILIPVIGLCSLIFLATACDDALDDTSIFEPVPEELDPNSESYLLDKFLQDNFLNIYNLQFRYKMEDVGSDLEYNLVPTSYESSTDIAILTKYLWFDAYNKVAGPEFLKMYGPRIIHLIGSPAYNPANGTIVLGTAEGGLKVTLYRCNSINPADVDMLNEFYFRTMHHEFAHIMHQTKTYPKEYGLISASFYDPQGWQDKNDSVMTSLGFVRNYATAEAREDFAETISQYITRTDKQWNQILSSATKGWKQQLDKEGNPVEDGQGNILYEPADADTDGVDGKAVILQKVSIARQWMKDSWNIDLDALRAEVLKRQSEMDIEALREEGGFKDKDETIDNQ